MNETRPDDWAQLHDLLPLLRQDLVHCRDREDAVDRVLQCFARVRFGGVDLKAQERGPQNGKEDEQPRVSLLAEHLEVNAVGVVIVLGIGRVVLEGLRRERAESPTPGPAVRHLCRLAGFTGPQKPSGQAARGAFIGRRTDLLGNKT